MAWIALAQFPGIFLYAYLGTLAQLGIKLFGRKTPPHPYEYVVWFGGLLLTALVTAGIGRVALRMLGEAGATMSDAVKEPEPAKLPEAEEAPAASATAL